jgi:hypothetical protein
MLTQSLDLIACYIACFKRSHADLLTSGKHCGGQENRELLETVDSEESAESLRLQDTLFGVLWKIATARSKSDRFSSNFHQMFASACKI